MNCILVIWQDYCCYFGNTIDKIKEIHFMELHLGIFHLQFLNRSDREVENK